MMLSSIFKRLCIFYKEKYRQSSLYTQISIVVVSTITLSSAFVAICSIYALGFSLQAWIDPKIMAPLEQSVKAAEASIDDNKKILKETALFISREIATAYYQIMQNQELLVTILDVQANIHGTEELLVINGSKNNEVIAQSSLSLGSDVSKISNLPKNDDPVLLDIDSSNKIRAIVKLPHYSSAYLVVGRLVSSDLISRINETRDYAKQYKAIKQKIKESQITLLLIFVIIVVVLLIVSIYLGIKLTEGILHPIDTLVKATQLVQSGDLDLEIKDLKCNNEIRTLILAFNSMLKQIKHQQHNLMLAQRSLAWSDIARTVAHEIKNPLTMVILSAERLKHKYASIIAKDEFFARYTDNILSYSNVVSNILSEFVNFARLPSPKFEQVNLVPIITSAIESRKILKEEITYMFDCQHSEVLLQADPNQMHQMLINLIQNAEQELLENHSKQKLISITLMQQQTKIILAVRDTGRGFDASVLRKATDAYFTTRLNGTGLGLAVVRKIAQEHGAAIDISNAQEGGGLVKVLFGKT